MKERLVALVKENTQKGYFKKNHAIELGKCLGLSRNWISQHLNELYTDHTFVKINTRPVIFIDRSVLKEQYHIDTEQTLFASYEAFQALIRQHDLHDFQKLIGHAGSLRDVVEKCKASISYPPHGLPTLLYGPTGTGKSTIVDLMFEYGIEHQLFPPQASYLHVNCSEYANNPELITANLFGYKKGAFTGADQDNVGMIEAADGGILFLDEVHCLKPECQEKLFLFMDSGNYHRLGDNEHAYHSDVLLIFATTEKPEQALLKTLLRRIPVRIELPSLKNRGVKEKSMLLLDALQHEAKKMKRSIRISNTAYQSLLHAEYTGNIGELYHVVQASCMNAFYQCKAKDELIIQTLHLPTHVMIHHPMNAKQLVQHQLLSLQALQEQIRPDNEQLRLFQALLQQVDQLRNNEIQMDSFFEQSARKIEQTINQILFDDTQLQSSTASVILQAVKAVTSMLQDKYSFSFQMNEIYGLTLIMQESYAMQIEVDEFLTAHKEECMQFIDMIQQQIAREYAISEELMRLLHMQLDIEAPAFLVAVFSILLHRYHGHKDINPHIGIILAHGYATASSMANAVNQLLGQYVYDAIDMPLDTSTETIVRKCNEFIQTCGTFLNLVLLVDMGSLEGIYEGLQGVARANIAIANHVNTKLALMIGEGLKQHRPIKEIFAQCEQQSVTSFRIIESQVKEKVIVCSCATGIGTAEKLKQILEAALPKELPVKVITYDYSTLLTHKLEDHFFDRYEVICIVGTLNANIEHIKFIPVEELIMNDSFDVLTVHFKDLLDEVAMEQFRKNLLKSFSLSNMIGSLTILNPAKLLEHVADAIDRLQQEMKCNFSYQICFGLYVHICCMIERLVTREGIEDYQKTLEECDDHLRVFVLQLKHAFVDVQAYYKVAIPIEEIEYIDLYITNLSSVN